MTENDIGTAIIASAMKVHTRLGPGLLESAYRVCLALELELAGLSARKEVAVPIVYGGVTIQNGYRIDLLVDGQVVVELKAQEAVAPVHRARGGGEAHPSSNDGPANVRCGRAGAAPGRRAMPAGPETAPPSTTRVWPVTKLDASLAR